ncbi:caspase family protein (plasmid) [Acaryochloris sp. 'Moss Beach']|uniref:nSTAND1 domain-containing NTPase n=1 Tax=Acaryochloris sp. 'Moss Beach' TaxID=2740837 RepID=UPI001F1AEE8E|nr:caspase family protein [Acaryochloris sp. 'Moss Beach']UJB72973.1 caspase family protein [Acaryochloris sp. 'Moss Beach']
MSRDALIVGINRYQYLPDLKAPALDAEEIARRLEADGDFDTLHRLPERISQDDEKKSLISETNSVTRDELEQALKKLFRPTSQQAPITALFYFSGHGIPDEEGFDQGYLATSDTDPRRSRSGLSLKWLQWLLSESNVKQQIIWLDCCYSGSLLINVGAANPGYGESKDRCFIASSRDFEKSWEDLKSSYSVLTKALLDGLDPNHLPGRWIDTFYLVDYVSQALKGELQTPICTNFGEAIKLTRSWQVPEKSISQSHTDSGICPYKGLEFFDCNNEDPKYFFGRTTLTDQLLDKVRQFNFLAIIGASGSGKSSVLRAGLLHQIKIGQKILGSSQWTIRIMLPGEHPLQSLALTLLPEDKDHIAQAEHLGRVEKLIHQGSEGLRRLIQLANTPRWVLVIDQFEEIFTLCRDDNERRHFLECLLGALDKTDNKLCLIIAMRADFFKECLHQEYSGLARLVEQHLVTVKAMSHTEMKLAVTKPAQQVRLAVEEELVEQVLRDVKGAPGNLPLLQYTLTQLWHKRLDNCLKLKSYVSVGGISGALSKRATEIYKTLSAEEQATAKYIFLSLTQLGEGSEDTRRRIKKQDLITKWYPENLINKTIKILSDEKLLITNQSSPKTVQKDTIAVIEVVHEALIRHWPLLRQWVEENRSLLLYKRKIEITADEWLKSEKSGEYIFHKKPNF